MGDYISRSTLLKEVNDFQLEISGSANAMALMVMDETKKYIIKTIEKQPTAFDLESIIKQLNENKEDVLKAIRENSKSEFEMIKIKDLKELFEEYTQEQIDIIKSAIKENGGMK